ncbi:mannose-1-phosphate guanylyltransferase/mannose-6-phosphate isomerase [Vibrio sp. SCSIO 43137]|uniref:mannose-1-phosphate guanylyltransferase/mannose-6-phosphate isomerase n=1 Tax=Vibrio sp. SCSIO 43137 TaxID=3021011 RepID=UPI002306F7FE|nr:mannose-1-phosphate guanylyltransferase/mannose-6-phosphate isomerase [Vibrio sp. SCSIO 43137]WCE29865.1 mannose-1-phosphate guanylyltransferase/mannose-6-phosphate isomerase [Vibrio sp. SCSIO 43137]
MFVPVIMAGGSGSRLWPLSRSAFPKQFLALDNHNSLTMLQSTLDRVEGMAMSEPIIISNEDHRFVVAEQVRSFGQKARIILEPAGRNTAPAIALAAFQAIEHGEDPVLLVLAADHIVLDKTAFQSSVNKALDEALNGNLVTFGIVPTGPETGYGYIQRGEVTEKGSYKVAKFVEKPQLKIAEEYVKSGGYYWNSGCFMFKASVFLEELKIHSKDVYDSCQRASKNITTDIDFIRIDKSEFLKCPDDSVDYAVMEHTEKAVVVPMDAGWSDVGSWSALWEVSEKDNAGNVIHGDAIIKDTEGCYIYAPNKLVASVGVKDIVVVETKDAVLVAHKDNVQKVKKIVEHLKAENRAEYREHREVYRPWGKSDAIDGGERYKVNRITVHPGKKQSLQMHYHRAEHWVVVSGTAKVSSNGQEQIITENQSLYIPVGVSHMVENPGQMPLELIEIQSGSYLNEDDVVRLEESK